jgi:type III secretion protein N (ATPase)
MSSRFDYISEVLDRAVDEAQLIDVKGRVVQVVGTIIKASVPGVKVGEICILRDPWENVEMQAEVIGFNKETVLLTALGQMTGLSVQTEVIPSRRVHMVGVGESLLGRVLDGLGRPIDSDEKGPLLPEKYYPVYADPPNPLERRIISKPISLGVKTLDSMLTCGEGQRMGIFAAAGGGKSTLLAQIVRNTEADVTVLALIGERGREVREFIEKDLGPEGLAKSVVVCSTSDRSAMERLKAAYVATSIAEYFRDKGKKVLLLMDSVTRFGRAQREIGLAAGEPPTRRGFPPSVFSELPKLMERAGNSSKGSITALYTVLVEGDDMTEPIADETRSILDGHIILSRKLAQKNHYPAIDVLQSVSRCQNAIIDEEHKMNAAKLRSLLAKYAEV